MSACRIVFIYKIFMAVIQLCESFIFIKSLHLDTLSRFWANQSLFLLLNDACLEEKQQIPNLESMICPVCLMVFNATFNSTNKTGRHNITEILLKVALNTIKQTGQIIDSKFGICCLQIKGHIYRTEKVVQSNINLSLQFIVPVYKFLMIYFRGT
jgi:hypothetical protein